MNNKVKKRKHRHRWEPSKTWFYCDDDDSPLKAAIVCKCGAFRPLNNKVEGVDAN